MTPRFLGCGITGDNAGRLRALRVMPCDPMQGWWADGVISIWRALPQRCLLRSDLLPAYLCGDGKRCVTVNAMWQVLLAG